MRYLKWSKLLERKNVGCPRLGEGGIEELLNGYKVSVLQDEKVMEI